MRNRKSSKNGPLGHNYRFLVLVFNCRFNIAEGSERKNIPDFRRFINIAQGSAAELRTQIYISREVNIFCDLDAKELIQELKSISKMLQSLHSSLEKL